MERMGSTAAEENPCRDGSIEIICGSMFSGKTEELIRRLNRALIARQRVAVFKPMVDKRYHEHDIVSHEGSSVSSVPVQTAADILTHLPACDVVGIDEAQFFDDGLIAVCNQLANSGRRVIIAGLDMDFQGRPFGPMPGLMAVAEFVTKVHAICMVCGELAQYSFRLQPEAGQVLLGEKDVYEARCRRHFLEGIHKKRPD